MPHLPSELIVIWLAVLIDVLWGEPPNVVHPVAWMGSAIAAFRRNAPKRGRCRPFVAGMCFVLAGACAACAIGAVLEAALRSLPVALGVLGKALVLKLMFSLRGLAHAGQLVCAALQSGDLQRARSLLGWHLVSRETWALDESQVTAATIESLAENASDSFVAPLLFFSIAGLPGAIAYRFLNTCDAILGYRDREREWLGKSAARLDDLVNLVPARVTAALIVLTGILLGRNPVGAAGIWHRDHVLTASPNSGHPMSAAAGVLGVELEKVGHYRLGNGLRAPGFQDIARATRLLWGSAALAGVAVSVVILGAQR
jgi:adenosylcobinamide-phosphate synthase